MQQATKRCWIRKK